MGLGIVNWIIINPTIFYWIIFRLQQLKVDICRKSYIYLES